MKFQTMNIRSALYTALMLVVTTMTQSCVNDNDPCAGDGNSGGEVKFRVNLNLGDLGHISRADGIWNPSGEMEGGSTFDNTIKMNEAETKYLHIMLINGDGDLLHLNLDEGFQFNPVAGGYDLIGSLDLSDKELKEKWTPGTYRVMVLANYRERLSNTGDVHFSTYTKLDDLDAALTSFSVDWYKDDAGNRNNNNVPYIPMWGMSTVQLKLDKDFTEVFSVDLLRSVAKVKIQLTKRLLEAGYQLVECETSNWNKKVYCTPSGWKESLKTSDLNAIHYDEAFHDNKSVKKGLTVTAPGFNGENDGPETIVYYLPEFKAGEKGANVTDPVGITLKVRNDIGEIETCEMLIDNSSLGIGYYKGHENNVNRNHIYKFTVDKEIKEGELSYRLECWNLEESSIGWDPYDYTFDSSDTESRNGYVLFPSYNSSNSASKDPIENKSSDADYKFTLRSPAGAVWKAFLVVDGVEYTAGSGTTYTGMPGTPVTFTQSADTPVGFYFGVGNDYDNNQRAVTTGVAREQAYNIKVSTRMSTTDFGADNKAILSDYTNGTDDTEYIALNSNGEFWRDNMKDVPTCYLIIRLSIDGINFTEPIPINPASNSGDFQPFKFPGDATHIQIRQLFPIYASKSKSDYSRLNLGMESKQQDHKDLTWWSYPMGHKEIPSTDAEESSDE